MTEVKISWPQVVAFGMVVAGVVVVIVTGSAEASVAIMVAQAILPSILPIRYRDKREEEKP